jgi:Domain of unknown function (DUF4214)
VVYDVSNPLFLLRTIIVNDNRKHRWIFLLYGIGWLVASDSAVAESKSDASKRSFAALLARRATVAAARTEKAAARDERAAHPTIATKVVAKAHAVHSTPVTNHVARASSVKPVTSTAVYGVTAATNVVPPSGYGSGRDAYVEALYPELLGRAATQSDVDYWSRVLYRGTQASSVAESIWNSQEHRSLERSGKAPNIPLATAYRRAYDWGLLHRK